MDTRRLKAFIKIVDLGALRSAAEHLHLSQPSLSQIVKDLEAHFGAVLLIRSRRGVQPTPAGERLYRHAQSVLRQLDQARSEVALASSEVAGAVTVGMAGTIAPVLSVPLLAAVQADHPLIRLRIVEGSHPQMAEMALSGRIDLAVSSGDPVRGLTSELFAREELVLVCSPGLAAELGEGPVSVADLADRPLVLPTLAGFAAHSRYRDLMGQAPLLNVIAELDSAYALVRAVEAGVASTIIGAVAAAELAGGLAVRRLTSPTLERELYLWSPAALPPSAPVRAVKDALHAVLAGMQARLNDRIS